MLKNKFLSLLLIFAMVITMMPATVITAFAAGETTFAKFIVKCSGTRGKADKISITLENGKTIDCEERKEEKGYYYTAEIPKNTGGKIKIESSNYKAQEEDYLPTNEDAFYGDFDLTSHFHELIQAFTLEKSSDAYKDNVAFSVSDNSSKKTRTIKLNKDFDCVSDLDILIPYNGGEGVGVHNDQGSANQNQYKIVLDLNGHVLNTSYGIGLQIGKGGSRQESTYADLTIKDSNTAVQHNIALPSQSGDSNRSFVFNGGGIIGKKLCIDVLKTGKLTIEGGSFFTIDEDGTSVRVQNTNKIYYNKKDYNGALIMTGGSLESSPDIQGVAALLGGTISSVNLTDNTNTGKIYLGRSIRIDNFILDGNTQNILFKKKSESSYNDVCFIEEYTTEELNDNAAIYFTIKNQLISIGGGNFHSSAVKALFLSEGTDQYIKYNDGQIQITGKGDKEVPIGRSTKHGTLKFYQGSSDGSYVPSSEPIQVARIGSTVYLKIVPDYGFELKTINDITVEDAYSGEPIEVVTADANANIYKFRVKGAAINVSVKLKLLATTNAGSEESADANHGAIEITPDDEEGVYRVRISDRYAKRGYEMTALIVHYVKEDNKTVIEQDVILDLEPGKDEYEVAAGAVWYKPVFTPRWYPITTNQKESAKNYNGGYVDVSAQGQYTTYPKFRIVTADGYSLYKLHVEDAASGNAITPAVTGDGTYQTFLMPWNPVNIAASFIRNITVKISCDGVTMSEIQNIYSSCEANGILDENGCQKLITRIGDAYQKKYAVKKIICSGNGNTVEYLETDKSGLYNQSLPIWTEEATVVFGRKMFNIQNDTDSRYKSFNNGYIEVEKEKAFGDNVVVKIDPLTDKYKLTSLSYIGKTGESGEGETKTPIKITADATEQYFTMPACDITLSATFEYQDNSIQNMKPKSEKEDNHGYLALSSSGDSTIVTAYPDPGYKVEYIKTAGGEIYDLSADSNGNKYYKLPQSGVLYVDANFKEIGLNVTFEFDKKAGVVSASTDAVIGQTVNVDVSAFDGYELKELYYISEEDRTKTNNIFDTKSFKMPGYNVKIYAKFERFKYNITNLASKASENANHGYIEVSSNAVKYNNVKVIVHPENGYVIDKLYYDKDTPINNYAFTMPEKDITITATFKKIINNTPIEYKGRNGGYTEFERSGDGTYIIKAYPNTGYKLNLIKVFASSGNDVLVPNEGTSKDGYIEFTNVNSTMTALTGIFEQQTSDIENKKPESDKLDNNGYLLLGTSKGKSIVTAYPETGYKVKNIVASSDSGKTTKNYGELSSDSKGRKYLVLSSDTRIVDAEFEKIVYDVKCSGEPGKGTITASPAGAKMGEKVEITVTQADNYRLNDFYYIASGDSKQVEIDKDTKSFVMPANNVTVYATFKKFVIGSPKDKATVQGGYISINKEPSMILQAGDGGYNYIVDAIPNTGYDFQSLYIKNINGDTDMLSRAEALNVSGNNVRFRLTKDKYENATKITGFFTKQGTASGNAGTGGGGGNTSGNDGESKNSISIWLDLVGHGKDKPVGNVLVGEKLKEKPNNPVAMGYVFSGWFTDSEYTKEWNPNIAINESMAPNGLLTLYAKWTSAKVKDKLLTVKKVGNKKVKLSWKKVTDASKYVVYGNVNGKKLKKIKTLKSSTRKLTVKKIGRKALKAKKVYKFYVKALDSKGQEISQTETMAFITGNVMKKYANVKKLTPKVATKELKVGETFTVGANRKMTKKGKKHLPAKYGKAWRYFSNCTDIATVDEKGNVKAVYAGPKGKATARIYIMDLSGKYTTVKVTVKK